MKKVKSICTVVVALALIVSSCRVEKREHLAGYHIEWNKGKSKTNAIATKKVKVAKDQETLATTSNNINTFTASTTEFIANNYSSSVENYSASPIAQLTKTKSLTVKRMEVYNSLKTTSTLNKLNLKQKATVLKEAKKLKKSGSDGISKGVYILLAIIIPFVAVGLATDWGIEVLWNILWTLLCGIPGIIHAFIILKRKGII